MGLFKRKPKTPKTRTISDEDKMHKAIAEAIVKRNYAAGQTTVYNETHWQDATGADANSFIAADVATTRNRVRKAMRDYGYINGMVWSLAYDIIGVGPKLEAKGQKNFDKKRKLERHFAKWCKKCDFLGQTNRVGPQTFAEMLRLAKVQHCESGAAIFIPQFEDRRFTLLMIEPDRLKTPLEHSSNPLFSNGIEKDKYGRPVNFYVLRQHPGSTTAYADDSYDVIPASRVIHSYRVERPGQDHGMPWLSSTLGDAASLEDFTKSVARAAKRAASISAVTTQTVPEMYSETEPDYESSTEEELPDDAILHMPYGRVIDQFKAEQPVTTFEMFKREMVGQIARPLLMPYGRAAGNSSKYNYASGQLDNQPYNKSIDVIRTFDEDHVIDVVFDLYLLWEAPPELLTGCDLTDFEHDWTWPGREHPDPTKDAKANEIRKKNGQLTEAEYWSSKGKNWQSEKIQMLDEELFEQQEREKRGLSPKTPAVVTEEPKPDEDDDDDEENTDEIKK